MGTKSLSTIANQTHLATGPSTTKITIHLLLNTRNDFILKIKLRATIPLIRPLHQRDVVLIRNVEDTRA